MGFLSSSPLLLRFLLVLTAVVAGGVATISLGSTLRPGDTTIWTSDNQSFSLSFIPYKKNSSLFLVAINYTGGIPVWSLTTILTDAASSFSLLSNGNLQLVTSSGSILWHSNTTNLNVPSASLTESGELKLLSSSSSSFWSSFNYPSNTVLEKNQNLTVKNTLISGNYSVFFTVLESC